MKNKKQRMFQKVATALAVALLFSAFGRIGFEKTIKGTAVERVSAEQTDFVMRTGASVRLNKPTGMRFRAELSDSLVQSVRDDSQKSFGMLIAPKSYFLKAETYWQENYQTPTDYVRALERMETVFGMSPAIRLSCTPVKEGEGWFIQGSIVELLYSSHNLEFCGLGFIENASGGETSYEYARYSVGGFEENSRSISYVATAALNDGSAEYTEEDRAVLKTYVSYGLNREFGVAENFAGPIEEEDIKITLGNMPGELTLGEEKEFSSTVEAEGIDGVILGFSGIVWKSMQPEIAVVDRLGRLRAVGVGEAEIRAYVGTKYVSYTVTVKEQKSSYRVRLTGGNPYLKIVNGEQTVEEGGSFTAEISVIDEGYGELSFRIGNTLYTTENGKARYRIAQVSENIEAEITDISSALEYFETDGERVTAGMETDKTNLPNKLILPSKSADGTPLKEIWEHTFYGGRNTPSAKYTNLEEVYIPKTYERIESNAFAECSGLKIVYIENEALAEAEGEMDWSSLDALEKIYVPVGSAQAFKRGLYWRAAAGQIEEFDFENH